LSGTLLLVVLFRLVADSGGFQELAAGVFGLALLWRSCRIGIYKSADTLTIRSWYRSWYLPMGAVDRVSAVPYSGYLNVQGHSPFFSMLMIAAEEKEIELPFTVDTRKRCRALASALDDSVRRSR